MRAWLVRAGRYGERESLDLEQSLVVIGWDDLPDLSNVQTREDLMAELSSAYPDDGHKRLLNWLAQLWAFVDSISVGDLVVLPSKGRSAVAIGRVTSDYEYRQDLPSDARHTRRVDWQTSDLPRTAIGQDLLYSLGAFLTVCEIKRHDAVNRLAKLAADGRDPGWSRTGVPSVPTPNITETPSDEESAAIDVQQYAYDQIDKRIQQAFAGHDMAVLVEAILQAQGMVTWRSPEGPDGGVDVLAGAGPLGMDRPRIAVQVKSSEERMGASVVRELQGVMTRFQADQGLFVAWGGLTQTADREVRQQFFRVRVWNAENVRRELLAVYDRLPSEVRAKLPLKQVWVLASDDEG
jgi:restriction system protein